MKMKKREKTTWSIISNYVENQKIKFKKSEQTELKQKCWCDQYISNYINTNNCNIRPISEMSIHKQTSKGVQQLTIKAKINYMRPAPKQSTV